MIYVCLCKVEAATTYCEDGCVGMIYPVPDGSCQQPLGERATKLVKPSL